MRDSWASGHTSARGIVCKSGITVQHATSWYRFSEVTFSHIAPTHTSSCKRICKVANLALVNAGTVSIIKVLTIQVWVNRAFINAIIGGNVSILHGGYGASLHAHSCGLIRKVTIRTISKAGVIDIVAKVWGFWWAHLSTDLFAHVGVVVFRAACHTGLIERIIEQNCWVWWALAYAYEIGAAFRVEAIGASLHALLRDWISKSGIRYIRWLWAALLTRLAQIASIMNRNLWAFGQALTGMLFFIADIVGRGPWAVRDTHFSGLISIKGKRRRGASHHTHFGR